MYEEVYRGQIYYAELISDKAVNNKTRPVIVVSNNVGNKYASFVLVVPVTSTHKEGDRTATHIQIFNGRVKGTVLCEQITPISKERLGDLVGCLSPVQVERLNQALADSLDLSGRFKGFAPDVAQEALDAQRKIVEDLQSRLNQQLQALKDMSGEVAPPVTTWTKKTYVRRTEDEIRRFIRAWDTRVDRDNVAKEYGFSSKNAASTFYSRHNAQ